MLAGPNTIIIKVPTRVGEKRVKEDVKKLLEEKYVSIESLRKKFKIKALREDVEVNERGILALRGAKRGGYLTISAALPTLKPASPAFCVESRVRRNVYRMKLCIQRWLKGLLNTGWRRPCLNPYLGHARWPRFPLKGP